MFEVPEEQFAPAPMGFPPMMDDMDSLFDGLEPPDMFSESFGMMPGSPEIPEEAPIVLQGRDLERFTWRVQQSLARAKVKMKKIHADAKLDRMVYKNAEREQEYPGQPNITTPLSSNKADGLLSHVVDAMEHRPYASFVPEGIGSPAEKAAQVAPVCSAYLEREINRGGSRERLIREMSKEAIQVGTGIGKLAMVQHPSGEWFSTVVDIVKLEHFYVDRVAVPNLKHCFTAYEERVPFYQLQEMADMGLIDPDALEKVRGLSTTVLTPTAEEEESEFREDSHAYQEETAIHKVYYCYMRYRAEGAATAELYEAIFVDHTQTLLSCGLNSVRHAFDHPPLALHRIGKQAKHLFGRGIMRRMDSIQQMADNAINSHLALNNLAASPPFLYRQNSPFGRLMSSDRRIVPGIGIPTLNDPNRGDVQMLDFNNPGLSLQDISVATGFADKATFTEEAIGTQQGGRKTLGQFRVEMQRGTMRVRLDLGDLAYDASMTCTMMWAMMMAYKIKPKGIVEVEDGGKLLATRDIYEEEITQKMDAIIMPMVERGQVGLQDLMEFEEEFNKRLTEDMIPSARRSDLTIYVTGTKIIADKAAELEMLNELTPLILQGIELMKQDSYFNYHVRSIIEAMGFKDVEKRIPNDPGVVLEDPAQRQALGAPLADTITHSSNMV